MAPVTLLAIASGAPGPLCGVLNSDDEVARFDEFGAAAAAPDHPQR